MRRRKLNLNYANTNALSYLPNMTLDFAQAIADWRGTNGTSTLDYASSGYTEKNAPFETEDEFRLVSGADLNLLAGDDLNRNGVLDANEKDTAGSGQVNCGLFEYTTVYTREPNFRYRRHDPDQPGGRQYGEPVANCRPLLTAANVSTSLYHTP